MQLVEFIGVPFSEEVTMKKSLQISEQRRLLKQEITELIEENLPAKILQFAGRSVQRLTRQTKPAPWYIGTLLLMLVSFLPQTLIAFILKQPEQVIGKGLVWSSSNVVVIPLIPTVYLITRYILIITRDHIVDAMNEWPCSLPA